MRSLERMILLDVVDSKWKDHLRSMDNLREGIGLRAYGQKDPLVEYKREAYEAFQAMIQSIKEDALSFIFRVQPAAGMLANEERLDHPAPAQKNTPLKFLHPEAGSSFKAPAAESVNPAMGAADPDSFAAPTQKHTDAKVGRNDPCPCGSGKKYKKCHGQ